MARGPVRDRTSPVCHSPRHRHLRRGAAAQRDRHDRDTLRQALEDAITTRAQAAAEPCQACAACPALLCPLHAAELDWVSLYRALAHDLGITLTQAREPDTAGTSWQGRL